MKKLLAIMMVLCLLLGSLAACGGPITPQGPDTPDEPDTPDTPGDPSNPDAPNEPDNPNEPEVPDEPEIPVEVTYVQTYPYTDADGALHIRYQDTYTFDERILGVSDEVITSQVCGTTTSDEAVIELVGEKSIRAVGCGSVTLKFRRESKKIIVDPSPINLLFVTGQSNASADGSFYGDTPEAKEYGPTYAKYFIRTAPTMAYFTWTDQALTIDATTGGPLAAKYVPTTLHWETLKTQSFRGCHPTVFSQETTSFANAGWSAALAHEWVEQTGERVWIVNASHGGMPISTFLPSEDGTPVDNDYYQALSVFQLALETIYREVEAGHFTLNHMAYYWFQGESDSSRSDAYYLEQFEKVHTGFQNDVVYRHGGVEKRLEYCGIMTLRSCKDNTGNSNDELYMTGPRLAQYFMGGQTEGVFSNVFIASDVTERWVGGDENVEQYFLETYGSAEAFYEIFGYDMPTTMFEVHPNIHYLMKGHNEMGMDAARNSLRIINMKQPHNNYHLSYGEAEKAEATLLLVDGVTECGDVLLLDTVKGVCIYPAVSPAYAMAGGVRLVSNTEGYTFEGYTLKMTDSNAPATISISLYLGKQLYGTYTMTVRVASNFVQNLPQYSKNADKGGFTFLGFSEPWECGYLTFANGSFTAFRQIEENGWLYNGKVLWGSGSNGGFFITSGMKIGLPSSTTFCPAIAYTVAKDGTVSFAADMFSPNLNDARLAIAVNGKMVWPTAGGSLTNQSRDWYYATKGIDNAETLNALWQELAVPVSEGDVITFLVAKADGVGQAMLYPTVYYQNKE